MILFTSGTSGVSKGAVLTHGGIRAAAANAAEALGFGPQRRGARRGAVLARARPVDGPRRDARDGRRGRGRLALRSCRDARVHGPHRDDGAARRPDDVRRPLRRRALAPIALPPLRRRARRRRPAPGRGDPGLRGDVRRRRLRGLRAHGDLRHRDDLPAGPAAEGGLGRASRSATRSFASSADGDAGEIGEVQFRGSSVIPGYWRGEGAELAPVSGDGWLATGDLGYVDDDGYLFLVDRLKDMIIRNGYNVYPREVEEVLYAHPDVLEAVVVGVPDARIGEEVVALVRPRPGVALRSGRGAGLGEGARRRVQVPAPRRPRRLAADGPDREDPQARDRPRRRSRASWPSSTASRPRPAARGAARTAPRRASGRPAESCGAASAASRRSSLRRAPRPARGARAPRSTPRGFARPRLAATRRNARSRLTRPVERGPDRPRGDDRVGDARVEPARPERREQVRRLADEQHPAARVRELAARAPAGRRRSRPTSRGRRTSASITSGSQLATPSRPLNASASSSGRHWRSTRQWPGERHEQHVAPVDRRMLVVEDPLHRQRVVGILGRVDDDERVLGARALERDLERGAHVRARPVRADREGRLEPAAALGHARSRRRRAARRRPPGPPRRTRRPPPAPPPGAAARSRPAAGSSRPGCTPAGGGGYVFA